MISPRSPGVLCALATLASAIACATTAYAVAFDVPNTHPTIQAAVADAALSPDVNNSITISVSPVMTSSAIQIGAAFGPTRKLLIRPAANLTRATIANDNPVVPIFDLDDAEHVTLQDLDILRNVTNGDHIVRLFFCSEILIERCRIGSHFSTTGTAGWANVYIRYPTEILLRNNILFANTPGTFDFGIDAGNFGDPANSLRLYNNVVADYSVYGVRIEAATAGALVLLRNNVVVNQLNLAPEPFAYRSVVGGGVNVVTSHNVAYASAPLVQSLAGQDIAGIPSQFLNFTKAQAPPSFVSTDWNMVFDANPDFYRLMNLGPLHDDNGDWGMTVTNAVPDYEVVDDIELDYRPGGVTLHSDRGADQLEPGTGNSDVALLTPGDGLRARVRLNPARALAIAYASRHGGTLVLEVADLAGRRLHSSRREVDAASSGTFHWNAHAHSGMVFYLLRLHRPDGGIERATGRAVLVR